MLSQSGRPARTEWFPRTISLKVSSDVFWISLVPKNWREKTGDKFGSVLTKSVAAKLIAE